MGAYHVFVHEWWQFGSMSYSELCVVTQLRWCYTRSVRCPLRQAGVMLMCWHGLSQSTLNSQSAFWGLTPGILCFAMTHPDLVPGAFLLGTSDKIQYWKVESPLSKMSYPHESPTCHGLTMVGCPYQTLQVLHDERPISWGLESMLTLSLTLLESSLGLSTSLPSQ